MMYSSGRFRAWVNLNICIVEAHKLVKILLVETLSAIYFKAFTGLERKIKPQKKQKLLKNVEEKSIKGKFSSNETVVQKRYGYQKFQKSIRNSSKLLEVHIFANILSLYVGGLKSCTLFVSN